MSGPNKAGKCENGYCEIPGRTFILGSPEGSANRMAIRKGAVTLPTQWLRRTEVTVDEMKAFFVKRPDADLQVVLSGCNSLKPDQVVVTVNPGESEAALLKRARQIAVSGNCGQEFFKGMMMDGPCGEMNNRGGNHPVVCGTQKEAEAFCASEGATLPSEDLIENASRGVSGTDEYGNPIDKAVIHENGDPQGTEAVCGLKNEREGSFGVCDLAGNVWERTSTNAADPRKSLTGVRGEVVVFRGGSFADIRSKARVAHRSSIYTDIRYIDHGFRCARRLPPQGPKT